MNPWALLVIAVGIIVIIIGVQGRQHEVGSAITGKTKSSKMPAKSSSGPTSSLPMNPA